MQKRMMAISDDDKGSSKTSLKMTRSMGEDIGMKIKKILEDIYADKVDLTYLQWQEVVSYCWSDEIWLKAINKAIYHASIKKIKLNKNGAFLQLIAEMTLAELKEEFRKIHSIAKMSLMDIINKKPPEPERKRKYEDLWLTPKELKELYKES